jgi:hypothetical protein
MLPLDRRIGDFHSINYIYHSRHTHRGERQCLLNGDTASPHTLINFAQSPMNKIYKHADGILEKKLNYKPHWFLLLLSFTCFGSVMAPILFKNAFLEQGGSLTTLFVMSMSYLTISFLYGLIFGFSSALAMKYILRFRKVNLSYSAIIKLFQISFLPYMIYGFVYLLRIALANYFESEFVQSIVIYIGVLYIPISLLIGATYIWILILLFRGMKMLTGLKLYENVLIYLGSGLVISPLNIILMYY